jgi:predicted GIY-YIG superfamily endonuclease
MREPRDTYNYDLKDGRCIVYRGITNDPDVRLQQHTEDGKCFTHMVVSERPKTRTSAKASEADALATYRRGHGGENPKYNKTRDG